MTLTLSTLQKTPLRKLDRAGIRTSFQGLLPKLSTEVGGAFEVLLALVDRLWGELDQKEFRLQQLLRAHFGRTSEKLDATQLLLFVGQLAAEAEKGPGDDDGIVVPIEPEDKNPPRKPRLGRNPLPDSLQREKIRILPPEEEQTCPDCGQPKVCIGSEFSELLEYVPAHFKCLEIERVKMACRPCESHVVIAPVMDKPIERGRPGPGLLAHVLVSKYADHQPLFRLSKQLLRAGIELAASTLGSWAEAGADLLEPLWKLACQETVDSGALGLDDTPIKVLDKSVKPAVKRGHLWAYVGYDEGVPKRLAYRFTPDWKGDDACQFLSGRDGPIQGDGYAGINPLFGQGNPKRVRLGCLCHARRKFEAAFKGGDRRAAKPLEFFARVYQVERLAGRRGATGLERVALREQYARPNLMALLRHLLRLRPTCEPKSALGKAITYTLNQWSTLLVYLTDGALLPDNNRVEQQLRPIALGRRNYLFVGSDAGGRRAAILYTMMGCCTLAKVEPFAWLRDVLDRLSRGWPARLSAALLPEHWRPNLPWPDQSSPQESQSPPSDLTPQSPSPL